MSIKTLTRRATELLIALALFSALIWLSAWLQGPFSMSGSAAAFILGFAFMVAFLRSIFLQWLPAVWFFTGAAFSTLWYPFAYTAVDSAYANRSGPSQHFCIDFLLALRVEAVYYPLLMLLGSILGGGVLGYLVKRLLLRPRL